MNSQGKWDGLVQRTLNPPPGVHVPTGGELGGPGREGSCAPSALCDAVSSLSPCTSAACLSKSFHTWPHGPLHSMLLSTRLLVSPATFHSQQPRGHLH